MFLTSAATLTLLVGIAPLLANLLASQIASLLGCYIAEYSIYSKAGTSADFSDDLPACLAGSRDVDALLIGAHNFGLAFAFTWPFLLVSAFLWLRLLMRRVLGS
jgi:hypothetical protein